MIEYNKPCSTGAVKRSHGAPNDLSDALPSVFFDVAKHFLQLVHAVALHSFSALLEVSQLCSNLGPWMQRWRLQNAGTMPVCDLR